MNTIRSTWIGWGSLIIAGGTAYFFAKRSVKADRNIRHAEDMKRRQRNEALEEMSKLPRAEKQTPTAKKSSKKAGQQDASTADHPDSDQSKNEGKPKFAASEPYRRMQGDRFS